MLSTGHPPPRPAAQGMAALTVVMVLFFIMALVAAYTNRNLVFEQRTAANSYKAERALMAADAAADWALTQLNSGRVDAQCEPSSDTANLDFRRRYLTLDAAGGYSVVSTAALVPLYSGCLANGTTLSCSCTSVASPTPALSWGNDSSASAFRVSFVRPGLAVRPGTITVELRGCATPGSSAQPCVNNLNTEPAADALSNVRVSLGLVRALPNPPAAALSVAGDASAASGVELRISNPDPGTGISLHAGGTVTGTQVLSGPAGAPGNGGVSGDASLANPLPAQAATLNLLRRQFLSTYGMQREEFMRQPAVVRVNCSTGCDTARLVQVINAFPRRTLWISGNLTLDSVPAGGGTLGSDTEPVMIIVAKADPDDLAATDGVLTVQAGVTINGFVHAEGGINWASGAAAAVVNGALVSGAGVSANGHLSVAYRRDLLDLIKLGYGSFVRVPGSWTRPS
ncbi:MAG: hypothetical protein KBC73_06575 [Burkholderiaceae bacterium]|nr:hypothetical protein [Burkholderiaceae bacterium]